MAAVLAPAPKFVALDGNGNPIAGARVYTYTAGTSTPKAAYTDASGGVAQTNPAICDASGRVDLWLNGAYKIVLKDASDVTIWTVDNIQGISADTQTQSTYAALPLAGTAGRLRYVTDNLHGLFYDTGTRWAPLMPLIVMDQCANIDPTGATSCTAGLQAVLDALPTPGACLLWSPGATYRFDTEVLTHYSSRKIHYLGYGATFDCRRSGGPTFYATGSTTQGGLTFEGLHCTGANGTSSSDFIHSDPKGSEFCMVNCSFTDFRHVFVHANKISALEQAPHFRFVQCNVTANKDTAIILANVQAPLIQGCRFKNAALGGGTNSRYIELGQGGGRDFYPIANGGPGPLNGLASSYCISGCLFERGARGAIRVFEAQGGTIQSCSFENNDDDSDGSYYHIDAAVSATYGDEHIHINGCDFGGGATHKNIRVCGGVLNGNVHKVGAPCINNVSDTHIALAQHEYFISPTTRIACDGKAGVLTQMSGDTYNITGISIPDDNTGIQISTKFRLINRSVVILAHGAEDTATGLGSADYQWYVRNTTDGTVVLTGTTYAELYNWGSLGSREWLHRASGLLTAVSDAGYSGTDYYALYLRNKAGAGAKTLRGFCTLLFTTTQLT
jgi:hypothetical protein